MPGPRYVDTAPGEARCTDCPPPTGARVTDRTAHDAWHTTAPLTT